MNENSIITGIVTRASDLGKQGAFDDAVEIVRKGLLTYPDDTCLLTTLGIRQHAQGNIEDAILTFRKVTELAPNNEEAHYNLGCALSKRGYSQESIVEFRISASLDSSDPDIYESLGYELATANLLQEALSAYETAIKLRPSDGASYMKKALILYDLAEQDQTKDRQRKWLEAKGAFVAAIEVSPDDSEAYYGLGVCDIHLKQFASSVTALENAIHRDRGKKHFYRALGIAQFRSLRWFSAWSTAATYCRLKQGDASASTKH